MRIAVIGAGGIGGIYGAALAQAGADVTFVARGAHLAAMRENGLRIEGDRGETHIQPAQATADIAGIGVVDYVLLCVKLWDVESAGEQIRPIVGRQTSVVPLQNGVDAADRLIPILGREAVMGGSAFVTGSIVAPGVIRQTGTYHRMTFGELDGGVRARGERLRDLCAAAGTRWRAEPRHQGAVMGEIRRGGATQRPERAHQGAARQISRRSRSVCVARGIVARDSRCWPRGGRQARAGHRRQEYLDDSRHAALSHDLNGQRSARRQSPRTAMVCWQSGRTWPPARHPDAGERLDLRWIEALCERAASIGFGRARLRSHASSLQCCIAADGSS